MTYSNESLPVKGRRWQEVKQELLDRRNENDDIAWDNLRNMKASYNAGNDVTEIAWEAYTMFKGDNLLYGGTLYPSVLSLAEDVINMALQILNAPKKAGGTITTGGTESILLAVRAAYNRARERQDFSNTPEIVAPQHVHPAFDKAASLMGLNVVRIPLKDYRSDIQAITEAITENTFMLVGSAHAYPLGHVDYIREIAKQARKHNLWVHVDACLGGFFLPFAASLGNTVPSFDFSVPGVDSISVDLHKYGYTARGASLILFNNKDLAKYHQFDFSNWPTGIFKTSTLTGSRPAGAVASAWAVMSYLGYEGYRDRVKKILQAKRSVISAAESVPGIHVCGNPEGGIVGFYSEDSQLDLLAVREGMTSLGWQTGTVIDPPGFQVLLNYRHGEIADEFGRDLSKVATQVKRGKIKAKGIDLSYGS